MRVAVVCTMALLVAGCAAPPADEPAVTRLGSVDGLLLDAAYAPLADVDVEVIRNGESVATTTSDDDGRFRFHDLPPGSYALQAVPPGHAPVRAIVDVRGTAHVTLHVPAIAGDAPHRLVSQVHGYFQCAVGVAGALANVCYIIDRYSGLDLMDDESAAWLYDELLQEAGAPDFVQAETYWQSTQPLSDRLHLRWDVQDPDSRFATCSSQREGTTPLIHTLYLDTITRCRLGPQGDAPLGLQVEFFPGRHDLLPAGAVLEQETETLFTAFYGDAPPVGWTLAADG